MADGYMAGAPSTAPLQRQRAEELPRKRMNSPADLELFMESRICQQLLSFASELSQAIRGLEISSDRLVAASALMQGLVELLAELESWLEDFPPHHQPMRFGNKAFRQWHDRLVERAESLLLEVLRKTSATDAEACARELAPYLCGAFGDPTRIDYGTGHEAAFFAILFILGARGVLAKSDAADAVLLVFAAYIRMMRRLQTVYILEPAGSHGVWGLDDFHALPFLFGAAQLTGMENDVPTGNVHEESIVREYADRYLYVDAIRQVLIAKKGAPFHETSPMLWDITAVPTWQKTHNGLVKMYRVEVMGKFPVIQHFLFGETIRWPIDDNESNSAASSLPDTTTGAPPSAAKLAVDSGVACVAPWAKAAGEWRSAAAQRAVPPGVACVAPWARALGATAGVVPIAAPWASKA